MHNHSIPAPTAQDTKHRECERIRLTKPMKRI